MIIVRMVQEIAKSVYYDKGYIKKSSFWINDPKFIFIYFKKTKVFNALIRRDCSGHFGCPNSI